MAIPTDSSTLLSHGPNHCPRPSVRPVASAAWRPTIRAHFRGISRTMELMDSAAWRARLCAISWPRMAARPSSVLAIGRMPLYTKTLPPGMTKAFFSVYLLATSSLFWNTQESFQPFQGLKRTVLRLQASLSALRSKCSVRASLARQKASSILPVIETKDQLSSCVLNRPSSNRTHH